MGTFGSFLDFVKSTLVTTKNALADPKSMFLALLGIIALDFLYFLDVVKCALQPLMRLFVANHRPTILRTPEARFAKANLEQLGYKFKSNFIEIPFGAGRADENPVVHYVDEYGNYEGEQRTILCLHGEPSWSFLYRKMVPVFKEAGYRVVVPDMIGFGKSDKYTHMGCYSHELHTFTIKHLIEKLDIRNITLVCQDWGGLVGLTVVRALPDRFTSLVVMNTGLPTGDFWANGQSMDLIQHFLEILPFLLWRNSAKLFGLRLPISWLFRYLLKFDENIVRAYNAPFPDPWYKAGAAMWPLLVPIFPDDAVAEYMVEARKFLKGWRKPVLVMFGDQDPITRGKEKLFLDLIPHAKNIPIKGAGHFLQETHGEVLAENVVQFLAN